MKTKFEERLNKIEQFINLYTMHSQKRGRMYGSVSEIESNWKILDHIFFIMNDLEDKMDEFNFSVFLRSKGFGAKSASQVIMEKNYRDPYLELNKLWNEYLEWRKPKIDNIVKAQKKSE